MRKLGTLGGESFALAINDGGQIAGTYGGRHGVPRAGVFLWENGTMYAAGLDDKSWTLAGIAAFNNLGRMTGRARNRSTGEETAVLVINLFPSPPGPASMRLLRSDVPLC
jgi:uncharacterized membrane protein